VIECRWCGDLIAYDSFYDCWQGETGRCPEAPGWPAGRHEPEDQAPRHAFKIVDVEPEEDELW
jgi:hypothetical protein